MLFKLALLAVAVAEECDEVGLLQKSSNALELDAELPDLTKILQAAQGALGKGIGKVTDELDDAFDKAGGAIAMATQTVNSTVSTFESTASANFTVAQNLTNFKDLIKKTVDSVLPSFQSTLKQVTSAVAMTKTVVAAMGQKDLVDKLQDVNDTVMDKLTFITETSKSLGEDALDVTEEKYGDYLQVLKQKLDSLQYTTDDFKALFTDKIQAFTGSLQGPLELALGEKTGEQLEKLTNKTEMVLTNLETLVGTITSGLRSTGDVVDSKLLDAQNQGFFGKIFHGLFR